ncbi:MAG: OmpA family protein [Desulfobulbaceae bacterium]|nr:OmpA family protein [Desulfobulbaceae bacterium]
MKRILSALPFFILLLLLSACSSRQNVIVLLPDSDGTVGAIEFSNEKGTVVVDEEGEAITVGSSKSAPKEAPVMSREEIKQTFREALEVEPLLPKSFLLYFKTGKVILTPESEQLVPEILSEIKKRQSDNISVIGHSDRYGSKTYNFRLSTRRAEKIRDFLVSKGVDAALIDVSSHGEGNPLIPTKDGVREQKNRRVEVVVR